MSFSQSLTWALLRKVKVTPSEKNSMLSKSVGSMAVVQEAVEWSVFQKIAREWTCH